MIFSVNLLVLVFPLLPCRDAIIADGLGAGGQQGKEQTRVAIVGDNEARPLQPENARDSYERGNVWLRMNNYEKAITEYSNAIRLHPNMLSAIHARAVCYTSMGNFGSALKDFNEEIRLEPTRSFGFIGRGSAYCGLREFSRAIADYLNVIRIDPGRAATAFTGLGRAHVGRKDYGLAVRCYRNAILLDPRRPSAYEELAWLLSTCPEDLLRRPAEALENARKACELTEWKSPSCLSTLGAAHAENNNFHEAIKWQKSALQYPEYEKRYGKEGRERVELYEQGKAFREK